MTTDLAAAKRAGRRGRTTACTATDRPSPAQLKPDHPHQQTPENTMNTVTTVTDQLDPTAEIILDIGDEDGRWIGCMGHVDRYDFMIAYAAHACDEYVEVGPHVPHPQHVYMVEFDVDDCDETTTATWWQLDAVNPMADRVTPITVLSMEPGDVKVTGRRVDADGSVLA